jgi:anti-sigma regulatory factor (Ser/Thr protein kinase)
MFSAAVDERRRAGALRAESLVLFTQTEQLSAQIAERLRSSSGRARGERGEYFSLRLPRLRPAVGLMRHELGRWLDRHGIAPDAAYEITLACSEACANAVEHPFLPTEQAFVVAAAERDGEVELVVRDFGRWRAKPTTPNRGRGLPTIRALMDDVEFRNDGRGTRVAMRRRLPATQSDARSGNATST